MMTHPTANAMLGAATGTVTVYMNTLLCPSLVSNYKHNTITLQSSIHQYAVNNKLSREETSVVYTDF